MCGIAGFWGTTPLEAERLARASQALRHRGPDGAGTFTASVGGTSLALVHRRLAIIDTNSRSDQPFEYDDSILIFNGAIYNYIELRAELEGAGHVFHTSGDTEVLAHALRRWGTGALDRCEGMWAFAWYDARQHRLILSRDRFGEKPFYLWRRPEGLYFASEIKGLAALAGEWPARNEQQICRYLVNGYKSLYKTASTFYEGVEELPLGSSLTLEDGRVGAPEAYWKPTFTVNEAWSYGDAVEATRAAVINAVRLRLRCDVPLAFCMSGGVDSNSLIATAARVLNREVHGFTIVNTDARYEESALVDQAVRELGIRHTAVPIRPDGFLDNLKRLVTAHDGPVYTIPYYVHWQLMGAVAAAGYKVSISGTAADELFTGYYDHFNLHLHAVAGDAGMFAEALAAWRVHQAPIVRNPVLQDPEVYLKNPGMRDHVYLHNDVFASWMVRPWAEAFTETDYGVGLLRNRMLNELFAEGSRVILHEDDLNAMSFSLENRSPFLDRALFDVAYAIPDRHLVRDGRAKAVLRDAMRGIVPDAILDSRRKVGFNAPILELLDTRDPAVRAFLLDDSPVFDLVQKERIEALLEQETLPNSDSKFLFNFVNVKMFVEN